MNKILIKYLIAAVFLAAGIILNMTGIGVGGFVGFSSVGSWLVYVSFVMFAVMTLQAMRRKKRTDERALWIAAKANRIVFVAVLILAFIVMVVDGILVIRIPYHMFMSYLMCYMLMTYFISYKVIERRS